MIRSRCSSMSAGDALKDRRVRQAAFVMTMQRVPYAALRKLVSAASAMQKILLAVPAMNTMSVSAVNVMRQALRAPSVRRMTFVSAASVMRQIRHVPNVEMPKSVSGINVTLPEPHAQAPIVNQVRFASAVPAMTPMTLAPNAIPSKSATTMSAIMPMNLVPNVGKIRSALKTVVSIPMNHVILRVNLYKSVLLVHVRIVQRFVATHAAMRAKFVMKKQANVPQFVPVVKPHVMKNVAWMACIVITSSAAPSPAPKNKQNAAVTMAFYCAAMRAPSARMACAKKIAEAA